ncbi:MAG: hypothetical protein RIQ84_1242 [Pseudomonadota bacterium]
MKSSLSNILESGYLRHRLDQSERYFEIRLLSASHLDDVMFVQDRTFQALQDKSIYYPSSRCTFEDSLSGKGLVIGCFVEDALIGFRSIWLPSDSEENLGIDIGIEKKEHLTKVAHLERACVSYEFTGNRLQIRMTNHAIELAKQHGHFRYLCSTVAPTNYASMQDKFSADMVIVSLLRKYENYYRYIFFRDILNPCEFNKDLIQSLTIDGGDIEYQIKLLHQSPRYIGYQQFRVQGDTRVSYGLLSRSLLV